MRSLFAFVEPNLDRLDNETCLILAVVGAFVALAVILILSRK